MTDIKRKIDWSQEDDEIIPNSECQVEYLPDGTKRVITIITKEGNVLRNISDYKTVTKRIKVFSSTIERQRRMKASPPSGRIISEPCISIGDEITIINPSKEEQSNDIASIDKRIERQVQQVKMLMGMVRKELRTNLSTAPKLPAAVFLNDSSCNHNEPTAPAPTIIGKSHGFFCMKDLNLLTEGLLNTFKYPA